jgi:RNA methyltransferase, TrmH family
MGMGEGYVPAATVDGGRAGVAAAIATVRAARQDRTRVVLEGFHALKHAVRFGADVEVVLTPAAAALEQLRRALAPDLELPVAPMELSEDAWRSLVPRPLPSPALSVARRPPVDDAPRVLAAPGRIVVLEQPRHLGNLGAVVRVAAAADAGGVLVVGDADPWHPTAVRGAAGLQFALRVARCDALPPGLDRPVVALDAGGDPLVPGALPRDAVLLVGTERGGLSEELRARATRSVAIAMREGVASLNLATAVAVALYSG